MWKKIIGWVEFTQRTMKFPRLISLLLSLSPFECASSLVELEKLGGWPHSSSGSARKIRPSGEKLSRIYDRGNGARNARFSSSSSFRDVEWHNLVAIAVEFIGRPESSDSVSVKSYRCARCLESSHFYICVFSDRRNPRFCRAKQSYLYVSSDLLTTNSKFDRF